MLRIEIVLSIESSRKNSSVKVVLTQLRRLIFLVKLNSMEMKLRLECRHYVQFDAYAHTAQKATARGNTAKILQSTKKSITNAKQ